MKRMIWLGVVGVLAVVGAFPQSSHAQNFEQLMKAVEKMEAGLQARLDEETTARQKADDGLRAAVSESEGAPIDPQWQQNIQKQLDQLSLHVQQLAEQNPAEDNSVSQEQWLTLMTDITVLKAENVYLRELVEKKSKQWVSIDGDGFYQPSNGDPGPAEIADKLNELTTMLGALQPDQGTASKPNPSVKHGKVSFSGMVHEHFVSGPDETSTFISKRARLSLAGDINEYAQIKIQADFATSPKLLDGLMTISPHQQWSFSVGQYKPPFGTDFLISATGTPFVNRSKITGLATDRDIGATLSFKQKFNSDYSLKLTAGMFNGSGINTSDVNNNKNFVARAEVTLGGMFTFAPNIYAGKTNEIDALKEKLVDFGSSATWKWRNEIIETEYIHSKHGDISRQGWYVWGGHSFDIGLGFLKELQLAARYEQYDLDLDVDGNRTDRMTLGTTLFVDKKYTKIQFNYELNNEQRESVDNNEFLVNVQVAF